MNWWGGEGDTVQPMARRNHAQLDVLKQSPLIDLAHGTESAVLAGVSLTAFHSFNHSAASQLGNSVLGLAGCQLEKREQLGHKSFIIQQTNPEFFIWWLGTCSKGRAKMWKAFWGLAQSWHGVTFATARRKVRPNSRLWETDTTYGRRSGKTVLQKDTRGKFQSVFANLCSHSSIPHTMLSLKDMSWLLLFNIL